MKPIDRLHSNLLVLYNAVKDGRTYLVKRLNLNYDKLMTDAFGNDGHKERKPYEDCRQSLLAAIAFPNLRDEGLADAEKCLKQIEQMRRPRRR